MCYCDTRSEVVGRGKETSFTKSYAITSAELIWICEQVCVCGGGGTSP